MFIPRLPRSPVLFLSLLLATLTMGCSIFLRAGPPFETLQAGMQSPAFEASLLVATQKYGAAEKSKYSKVKIESPSWETMRNQLTGIILTRFVYAWAYATEPDGQCSYERLVYQQEFDGHHYSPLVSVYQDPSPEGGKTHCSCSQ